MATLLIDYSYFEENPANQSGGAGDLAFWLILILYYYINYI